MKIESMKIISLWVICHGATTSATDDPLQGLHSSNLFDGDATGEHVTGSDKSLPTDVADRDIKDVDNNDINIFGNDATELAICHMSSPSSFATMTFSNKRTKMQHLKENPSDKDGPCIERDCEEDCPKGYTYSDGECTCSLGVGGPRPTPVGAPTTRRPTLLNKPTENEIAICSRSGSRTFVTKTFSNKKMKRKYLNDNPSDKDGPCIEHCEEVCPKGYTFSDGECTCSLGIGKPTPRPTPFEPPETDDDETAICHMTSSTTFITRTFPNKRMKVKHLKENASDKDGPCVNNCEEVCPKGYTYSDGECTCSNGMGGPTGPTPKPTSKPPKNKGKRGKIEICHEEVTLMKTSKFVTTTIRKSRLVRHMMKNPNDMEKSCSEHCNELCFVEDLVADDCDCSNGKRSGPAPGPDADGDGDIPPAPSLDDDLFGGDGGLRDRKRRKGKLGTISSHILELDCSRSIELKLFDDDDDSETLTFQPNAAACRKGKGFAGNAANGRPYTISLVGSRFGSRDTFAASVNNFETGEVTSIRADANGAMFSTSYVPEDFEPEDSLEEDDDHNSGIEFTRALLDQAVVDVPSRTIAGLRGGMMPDNDQRDLEEGNTQVDILVVYTADAECWTSDLDYGCTRTAATENNMRNLIELAIVETNAAFTQSGVNMEFNLVHASYTEYTEADTRPVRMALGHLEDPDDGYMDEVHQLRTQYGADVVSLITGKKGHLCGQANPNGPTPETMFSVTLAKCATGKFTFGHEIAHNFGCRHDRGYAKACDATASKYGYRDPDAEFVTILGRQCNTNTNTLCPGEAPGGPNGKDCTSRIQYFSNPIHQHEDKPMGSETSDNVAHLNSVKDLVAAYYTAPAATAEPTSSPVTPNPTVSPSKEPSSAPTKKPTNEPTASPITPNPTLSPSNEPTQTPTKEPTQSPVTPNPTVSPSNEPTQAPTTKEPTQSPVTPNPTVSPSNEPTQTPTTKEPTQSPVTPNPTVSPSTEPN